MWRRGMIFWCDVRIGIVVAFLLFMAGYLSAARAGDAPQMKIIAKLCSVAAPLECRDTMVTSSDFEQLQMSDCYDQAKLAEWMKQHPAERVAKLTCVFGKREGRGI